MDLAHIKQQIKIRQELLGNRSITGELQKQVLESLRYYQEIERNMTNDNHNHGQLEQL